MMFIETLEFTIPVDLCSLCTTLQKGTLSDLEFPASVNSYGTTQDASIQVALRANKLTFKIDGVSSNASIISKSECKTLKLSVFDVDRSLIPQENYSFNSSNVSYLQQSTPVSNTLKRTHEQFSKTSTPLPTKVRRTSHDTNRKKNRSPNSVRSSDFHTSHQSKEQTSNNIIVKTEPSDPDLIEIEPDPEPIKTEDPQTQTDNSAIVYPQTSHSSTSLYERNVPHVPDYAEATTSHHDQQDNHTVEDFLVFQDDNYDAEDNEAEYSNDGIGRSSEPDISGFSDQGVHQRKLGDMPRQNLLGNRSEISLDKIYTRTYGNGQWACGECGMVFTTGSKRQYHMTSVHGIGNTKTYGCICGNVYKYPRGLHRHKITCAAYKASKESETQSLGSAQD